ncbi:hypothetical protein EHS25_001877 [Saitozyma podzolica]|uniref:Uncharacterized protein n=1 Tax=Saitozyma podzolica TaxID=1890683 RepID=A0A427YFE2_9TREE|nr:hypothetical protein EHS25_001877 [Saitozyma podzolica]
MLSLYQFTCTGTPTAGSVGVVDVDPEPTTVTQVVAETLRADSVPGDPDYNSAGTVETVTATAATPPTAASAVSGSAVASSSVESSWMISASATA